MTSRFRGKLMICSLVSFLMTLAAAGWSLAGLMQGRRPDLAVDSLEYVVVRRADLDTTLLAGGDLQPAKQATVTCEVEDVTDSDGTMVLSVIENGAPVKKGDEICRLDSSAIEELARKEEILVNQARAFYVKARLDFETAKIALREYQEGLVTQWTKEFEITYRTRSIRRKATGRPARLGGGDAGQRISRRRPVPFRTAVPRRLRHELTKTEGEYELFRRFQVPKEIHSLRGQIQTAEIGFRLEADRLKAEEDELAYLRKQIENCTIRAPQDGVVVHAHRNRWWGRPLEPGTRVYQEQALFLIPDLSQMEVDVSVHESMGPRVRAGMKAKVKIASRADQAVPGRVVAVNLLPTSNWKEWDENLKHFFVRVRLDEKPAKALPYMSATVEIDTGRVSNALFIPVEAMAVVDGQQSCYVVTDDGVERRAIKTRRATRDVVEITAGLQEGERVLSRSLNVENPAVRGTSQRSGREIARNQSVSPRMSEARARSTPRSIDRQIPAAGDRSTS